MISALWIFVLVTVFITLISGTILNSSIIYIYLRSWGRQNVGAGESDIVGFTMAATNVLLQCLMTCGGIIYYSGLFLQISEDVYLPFLIIFQTLIDACFWNTSWLSISYCFKLVNLPHRLLSWLKSKFPSAVTPLLIGFTLGSFVINIPIQWTTIVIVPAKGTHNSTISNFRYHMNVSYKIFKTIFGSCLPFIITFICIVLSVTSLLKHVWRIMKNTSHIKYSQLEVHMRAARTMILRVFLDLVFCILNSNVLFSSSKEEVVLEMLSWIFVILYPTLQSVILIIGNPKFKRQLFG